MRHFLGMIAILLSLFALLSPSFATGVCVAHGGLPLVTTNNDDAPIHVPNPCEMQGGKRVMPSQPDFRRFAQLVDPGDIAALWAAGLSDEPGLEGRTPAMELPPPRLG